MAIKDIYMKAECISTSLPAYYGPYEHPRIPLPHSSSSHWSDGDFRMCLMLLSCRSRGEHVIQIVVFLAV